jgi:Sad1 / UNC-like C-terminal
METENRIIVRELQVKTIEECLRKLKFRTFVWMTISTVFLVAFCIHDHYDSSLTHFDGSLVDLYELSRRFSLISEKLWHQIEKNNLDKTGRVDLALESSGARIAGVGSKTELFYSCNSFWKLLGCPNRVNGPEKMIQPSMHPGECFKFKGKEATVFIRLNNKEILDAVTVEHTTKKIDKVSSAPRIFSVSVNILHHVQKALETKT